MGDGGEGVVGQMLPIPVSGGESGEGGLPSLPLPRTRCANSNFAALTNCMYMTAIREGKGKVANLAKSCHFYC